MKTVWLRRAPRYFRLDGVDEAFARAYHESLETTWHLNETVQADLVGEELAALVLP